MAKINKKILLETTGEVFAKSGIESFSIRNLASEIPISPSVIYHYFDSQDDLLRAMFDYTNKELGKRRAELVQPASAKEMLKQRIAFQIDNQDEIVAVLKYYLAYRDTFEKFKSGFVPDKSALHIEEVLRYGLETGEFELEDLEDDAKVIAHAINGFLLEFYPHKPEGKEKEELINRIYSFIIRAIERR